MAGDWIKVEKASPNKPEVLKIARMLGVRRQHAFGLLVEFWIWLDSNCVDGVVDGVVEGDVDAMLSCPGLASLLVDVGWVNFDKERARMMVVNFSRHNGETSKNRALKSERQARWRAKSVDGVVDVAATTREEKRREEKKQRSTTTAPNAIAFDAEAGWSGIEEADLIMWRSAYPAVDLPSSLSAAAAWARANPKNGKANWRRFITNWLGRAQQRAPARGGGTARYVPSEKAAL